MGTFPISLNSGVRTAGMILRILLALALRIVSAFGQDPSDRKNVLLIIADDFRPNVGVLESENSFSSVAMVTPNLDRLAARSLVLTNAYTQVALCGPSRNSFMTGRRPDTTRCYVSDHKFRLRGMEEAITMPGYFKMSGYETTGAGKIFHPGIPNNNNGDDYPQSWSHKIFHTATTDNNTRSWYAYSPEELEQVTLRDVANTDYTVQRIGELAAGNKPFFYVHGFHKPHMPWDAPQEFFDLYPEDSIDLPHYKYIPEDLPASAWTRFTGLLNYPDCSQETWGLPLGDQPNVTYPDSKIRELRRAYYASISFMDHQLGRVLDAVEEAGAAENTVIMFIGDHGLHVGEHAEWDKYTNYDLAHKAPMMLHVPGRIEESMLSENLVEFVDIMPTLVEAAGLSQLDLCPEYSRDIPICREGMSLLKIPEGEPWKDAIFWQQPRGYWVNVTKNYQGYTVRTEQYRYSEYVNLVDGDQELAETQAPDWTSPEDWGELYDLANDPEETVNLYRVQEFHDVKISLRKILYAGWTDYNY